MATLTVDDVSPRIQYTALLDQTIFIYPFVIFEASDLVVFKTPVGQPASDTADILQLNIDYQVTGIENSNGGTIVLTNPTALGDIITIERGSPIERTTNFTPGSFTTEQMNDALNSQTTFSQDNEMISDKITPKYQESAVILAGQVILPQLGPNQVWKADPLGNGIIAVDFSTTNCDTLRQDLAVEAEFTDGARLVGYFDDQPITGVGPTTVRDALSKVIEAVVVDPLEEISANNNIILGGDFSTNPFQEGESFTSVEVGTNRYVADGWGVKITGTTMRAITAKDLILPVPLNLSKVFSDASLKITNFTPQAVLLAGDRAALEQPIEGYYWRDVAQRPFFISFYVRTSVIGIYCVALVSNSDDQSFVQEYEITVANAWTPVVIEVPASNVAGGWGDFKTDRAATLHFTLAAGVNSQQAAGSWIGGGNKIATANQVNFFDSAPNSTFNINLIQIEPAKKTPFEMRSQQQEIAFAQRYFEKSYNIDVPPGTITNEGRPQDNVRAPTVGTGFPGLNTPFSSSKRIVPLVQWFSPITGDIDRVNNLGGGDLVVLTQVGEGTSMSGHPGGVTPVSGQIVSHFRADARMPL